MLPGTRASMGCRNLYKTSNDYNEITCLETGVWDHPVLQCVPGDDQKLTLVIECTTLNLVLSRLRSSLGSRQSIDSQRIGGQARWLSMARPHVSQIV